MMRRILAIILLLALSPATAQDGFFSTAPTPTNAVNVTSFGASSSASDNAAALQAAINAAVAANQTLYIPSASSCYKYTAPLTISGNLQVFGDYVAANYTNNAIPAGSPLLVGSVLCPTANGNDAIDISGSGLTVNFNNIGILFQTTFGQSGTTTGDAIHYVPANNVQGLSGAVWNNVQVWGHDGNHYAFNFKNMQLNTFTGLYSWGGGGIKYTTNSTVNDGNAVFIHPYHQVLVGGSANGIDISGASSGNTNLMVFVRPQVNLTNIGGVSPPSNPPTSAQYIFHQDSNSKSVRLVGPDLETNVSSPILIGRFVDANDPDWTSMFTTAGSIQSPAWLTNGILYGIQTRTLTDTTSSGTVAAAASFAMTGTTIAASSATTYTEYATLNLGTPTAGTNVTITTPYSLSAVSNIKTQQGITAQSGVSNLAGTLQFNVNAAANQTFIGLGSTTGTILIGGGSNETDLGSATLKLTSLTTDATHTTRTVCQDTSSNQLYFGSGAAGVCLGTSSARFKHDIKDLDAGIDQIMALRSVSFKYNKEYGDPNHVLYGFTAEDGVNVLPQLVGRDVDGRPNSMDYLGVVPVLVKAMQDQQKEILLLKAAIRKLKGSAN